MNEERIGKLVSRVAALPLVLSQGKMLGRFSMTESPTGEVYVNYGVTRGSETFASMAEAKAKVLPWLEKRVEEGKRTVSQAETLYRMLSRM